MKLLLDNFWILRNELLAERRQGCRHARDIGSQSRTARTASDPRTGRADIPARERSGHLRVARVLQVAGGTATSLCSAVAHPIASFWDDPYALEAGDSGTAQEAWSQAGTYRRATAPTRSDRPSR